MRQDDLPIVHTQTPMADVMREMSRGGMGMTCVVDADARLVGITSPDGDLRRRTIERAEGIPRPAGRPFLELPAADVMTGIPSTKSPAPPSRSKPLRILEDRKIRVAGK